ncbi:DUF1801 domain-containing protein [Sphingomonas humi]|uniref:DUF1801 domain-containing protein n=1 Tax=Sphingomonas humi TaxID=335630 RepID=A0ABP7REU9_9SPHN
MTAGPAGAALLDELCAPLTPERAGALRTVYRLVRDAMPEGYEEAVSGRMICWSVPLARFPKTYNKQPLMFAALAATKGHNALHLPLLYMSPAHDAVFRKAYADAGQKLDMGKGCVRFTRAEALNEAAIAQAIAAMPVEQFLATYEAARAGASSAA